MLSDFYTLRIKDVAGKTLWDGPQPNRPGFVALDVWDEVFADYTVRIYYATLFPFARGEKNLDERLSPAGAREFISGTFTPIIRETWRTQVEAWGFGQPLHPDWDADRVVEVIITDSSLALFGGTGTYTVSILGDGRFYPERRIWWRANSANFLFYDTLEDGYKVVFAHEFFHLMQTNVLLSTGHPTNRWHNTFIEAQAAFVSGLQYPELSGHSAYTRAANRFLAGRLNTSYNELLTDGAHPYDATLYWRFLYEQYQDKDILRAALEEMAQRYGPDLVGAIGGVMDRAFARFDGPYHSFEESLVGFARANYALRLENGRCADGGLARCGGLYFDPGNMYVRPRLDAERRYDGEPLIISGAIPASYGMDFVEIGLDAAAHDRPLTIQFQGEGSVSRFNVRVWRLAPGGKAPRAITLEPEVFLEKPDGAQVYINPRIDTTVHDRLALIITRLDPNEVDDPDGNYTITVTTSQ